MKQLKKKWIYAAGSALLLAFLIVGVRQIWAQQTNPLLSEQDVKQIISDAYVGTVQSIQLEKNSNPPHYVVKLKNGHGWYELNVSCYNGDILHLKQINGAGEDITNPNGSGNGKPSTGHPNDPNQSGDGSTTGQKPITEQEAKQIAKTQFSGKLTSIALKKQPDGSRYYVAKLEDSKKVVTMHINEADGKILKTESTLKSDKKPTNSKQTPITEAEAKSIALKSVKGTITSIEQDDENGVPVYEVEVKTAKGIVKVYINAYSGAVIAFEEDDDDGSDDDGEITKEVKGVSTDTKNKNNINNNNSSGGSSNTTKPSKPTPDKNNNTSNNNATNNNGSSTDNNTSGNNDDDNAGVNQDDDDNDDDDGQSNNDSNNNSDNNSSSISTDDDNDDF